MSLPTIMVPGEGSVRPEAARRDLGLIHDALVRRWDIPAHTRAKAVDICTAVLDIPVGDSTRLLSLQLLAVRTLAMLDVVNVRRERNVVQAVTSEAIVHTDRLRTLLSSPEGRAALAQLTATSQPPAQQQDTPTTPDSTPSVSSGNVSN